MPSMPFLISSPILLASALYSTGDMFSEKTAKTFSVSKLQMSASSGTAPYSSPGEKAGITAPVR